MKKIMNVVIVLIFCFNFSEASTLVFESKKGQVSYLAKGRPAFISIKGNGEGVVGNVVEKNNTLTGEISFDLNSLQSGVDLRDEHLKNKYLEIAKYPKASLALQDLVIPEKLDQKFPFTGALTLHGVTQKIEGSIFLTKKERLENVKAEFQIKLSAFNVEIPNFQGITVAEDVQVTVDLPISKIE